MVMREAEARKVCGMRRREREEEPWSILASCSLGGWLHWCVAPVPEHPSSRWPPRTQVALWGEAAG